MRLVLDTNVLSELMRPEPHPAVLAWVAAQPRGTLHTTRHNQAEILYGIEALPDGRRRDALAAAASAVFTEDMADRILPFDAAAVIHYSRIAAARRRDGNPIEAFDALIAATALSAGAGIATRDVGGFQGCSLACIVNPWNA